MRKPRKLGWELTIGEITKFGVKDAHYKKNVKDDGRYVFLRLPLVYLTFENNIKFTLTLTMFFKNYFFKQNKNRFWLVKRSKKISTVKKLFIG